MNANSAYLVVLSCVARADGIIAGQERDAILLGLERFGGTDEATRRQVGELLDMTSRVNVEQLCREAISSCPLGLLPELVRDAYVVAAIDGEISQSEVALIDALLEYMGIEEQRRPTLHQWAESAARSLLLGAQLFTSAMGATQLHESQV